MNEREERLQAQLEALEAGKSLAELTADLSAADAELLQLAAALRKMEAPARDKTLVTAQKAAVLDLARHRAETKPASPPIWQAIGDWIRGHRQFTTTAVALAAVVLLVVFAWPRLQTDNVAELPATAKPASVAETADSQTAETQLEAPVLSESVSAADPPPAAPDATYQIFVPMMDKAGAMRADEVELRDPVGLVEIKIAEGAWTAVSQATILHADTRVRTGNLSTAQILFFDGSRGTLGPNSEISLDTVDAKRPENGFRTVLMTQLYGESEHQVQFRHDAGSSYVVETPSGGGIARGTQFRVHVDREGNAEYTVTEGRVDVSNLNRTVQVTAGQRTSFTTQTPPADPSFIVTGEGIVTDIGPIWVIAGQSFAVNENTDIVGDPQVGDLVQVIGHLQDEGPPLADRIELLRPTPDPGFELTGLVDAIAADTWVIAGQTISVTADTEIDAGIVVGDRVRAEGRILPGGTLQAEEIRLLDADVPQPFEFTGVVQSIMTGTWTVSGVNVSVDADTEIDEGIRVGDLVKVEGHILADGTWLADEIRLEEPGDAAFTISGNVETIDPWRVSGVSFVVEPWTVIEPGIAVGDMVRVSGRILSDGTWVAYEIKKLDDDDTLLQIVFVGTVDAIDPWIVNTLPLVTDASTLIDPGIAVGDLVRVTAIIRSDNTWLATRIEKLDAMVDPGCVAITAVITAINDDAIVISNGQTIILGPDIVVDGELQVGSVILIVACANADGTITIISITVIADPPPPPTPQPTPPPSGTPGPPPPGGGEDYVTICHKPGTPAEQTKTIPRPALNGHLGHGDTIGPCP